MSTEEAILAQIREVQEAAGNDQALVLVTAFTSEEHGKMALVTTFVTCDDDEAKLLEAAIKRTVDQVFRTTGRLSIGEKS